jgi:hypothetical protein
MRQVLKIMYSFGLIPDPSDSYSPGFVTPQNPFFAPLLEDLDTNVFGLLVPNYEPNKGMGCSLYRYYIGFTEKLINTLTVNNLR